MNGINNVNFNDMFNFLFNQYQNLSASSIIESQTNLLMYDLPYCSTFTKEEKRIINHSLIVYDQISNNYNKSISHQEKLKLCENAIEKLEKKIKKNHPMLAVMYNSKSILLSKYMRNMAYRKYTVLGQKVLKDIGFENLNEHYRGLYYDFLKDDLVRKVENIGGKYVNNAIVKIYNPLIKEFSRFFKMVEKADIDKNSKKKLKSFACYGLSTLYLKMIRGFNDISSYFKKCLDPLIFSYKTLKKLNMKSDYLYAKYRIGDLYLTIGKMNKSKQLFSKSKKIFDEVFSEYNPNEDGDCYVYLNMKFNYAHLLNQLNDLDRSLSILEDVITISSKRIGNDSRLLMESLELKSDILIKKDLSFLHSSIKLLQKAKKIGNILGEKNEVDRFQNKIKSRKITMKRSKSKQKKFVHVQKYVMKRCSNIYCTGKEKSKKEFKCCSRCKAAFYCSRKCQTFDWKLHKKLCKSLHTTV